MNNDTVISVENLSKKYLIGHESAGGQESFREMLGRSIRRLGRTAVDMARGQQILQGDQIEEFWALKDVSFEVKRGQVMGVIGRNGAGKSTLLKILSRITEPSEGQVCIRGRVASLLEVGTGFHQDLTGRENIFLNGAILGMSRQEIRAKFDEIVAFSEVEKFLDTPVKRYSSGMYVRLAFAVAAHLEPEILIIDEVLAVGDIAFQKKCLGKMQDVAQNGRTVIFVSHNLPAVLELTQDAVLIERGRVAMAGGSREVVAAYMRQTRRMSGSVDDVSPYRRTTRLEGFADISAVTVCGVPPGMASIQFGEKISIEIELRAQRALEAGIININVLNDQLEIITTIMSADSKFHFSGEAGAQTIRCDLGHIPLSPGEYMLTIGTAQAGGGLAWDVLEAIPGFRIDGDQNAAWLHAPDRPGCLLIDNCEWSRQ